MALSIFEEKDRIPREEDLSDALGITLDAWSEIKMYVLTQYPGAIEKWSYPGKKYGWSFSLKDKKRAIIYLTPSKGYFIVGIVFGQKATDAAMSIDISVEIKEIIASARVYAEGRGFRIEVHNNQFLKDIKSLIDIKIAN